MTVMEFLPMVVYVLLIILLVILIILGIKIIFVVDKTDKLVEDVKEKVNSFNSVFKLIEITNEKLSGGLSIIIESIIGLVNKIFRKRKENKEDE